MKPLTLVGLFLAFTIGAVVQDDWVALYKPYTEAAIPYRLLQPLDFDSSKRYPVIVSLHGGGGRGTDNRKQLRGWNRLLAAESLRAEHPSYVLAPQSSDLWDAGDLRAIQQVIEGLPAVDSDRIYALGHSMGGHGTFILLQLAPDYFAAAAPSAGTGLPDTEPFIDPSLIKDIPIWAFHGDADKVAPYSKESKLFEQMAKVAANMKLTTWTGDGHGVANKMFTGGDNGVTRCASDRCSGEPDMMAWLFSQTRASRD